MKKVLGLLVFVLASIVCSGQDVKIPSPVAQYYLEVHDKYIILLKKDTLSGAIIENLTYTIRTKDLYIKSLKESLNYQVRISDVKDQQIILRDDQVKDLLKQIRRQRLRTTLIIIGEAAVIILLII
jgi:hypothetical protein